MAKEKYMALADFQTLWTNMIKPSMYGVATATEGGGTSGTVTLDGSMPLYVVTMTGDVTSVSFASGKLPDVGHNCHVVFRSQTAASVSLQHVATGTVRYVCPDGESPAALQVKAGGYAEVDFLRGSDTTEGGVTVSWIYVRGI